MPEDAEPKKRVETISVRNKQVINRVYDEMEADEDLGRNAVEATEELINEAIEVRRVNRAKSEPANA